MDKTIKIKGKKYIIEPVEDCELVNETWVANGHDCWGNTEGYNEYYVIIKGKSKRVFEGWYVIHNFLYQF